MADQADAAAAVVVGAGAGAGAGENAAVASSSVEEDNTTTTSSTSSGGEGGGPPPPPPPPALPSTIKCEDVFSWNPSTSSTDLIGIGATCNVYRCSLRADRPAAWDAYWSAFSGGASLPTQLCVKVYHPDKLRLKTGQPIPPKSIEREFLFVASKPHRGLIRSLHMFLTQAPAQEQGAWRATPWSAVHVVQEYAPGAAVDRIRSQGQARIAELQSWGGSAELFSYFHRRHPRGRGFTEPVVRHILWQMLSPVMYLHEQSPPVIHRDLKPENTVVCSEVNVNGVIVPQVKLMDFGFARQMPVAYVVANSTVSSAITGGIGSGSYMAPEVYKASRPGATYDAKCDIYSLGITLYHLMTSVGTVLPSPIPASPAVPLPEYTGINADLDARSRAAEFLSECGQKLMWRMVSLNPLERPTARECLEHPWFDDIRQEAATFFDGDDTLLRLQREARVRTGELVGKA